MNKTERKTTKTTLITRIPITYWLLYTAVMTAIFLQRTSPTDAIGL